MLLGLRGTDIALSSFDGKIWVLGGSAKSYKNDVWYSTDGINWSEATKNAAWSVRWKT